MKTYFRWSLIILGISVFIISSYGQANRFVSVGIYNSNLVKYLLPEIKGSDTVEIISFIEKPAFVPESAFRIIRSHAQFTIEGRFCTKNYWNENISYFAKNGNIPAPQISFHSFDIGDEFAHQLALAFHEEVRNPGNKKYETLDGTCYVLRYKNQGKTTSKTIDNPMNAGYKLCEISSNLAKDLKNKTFDELKYLKLIKRDDISDIYHSNLKKYLLPKINGADTTEIISFMERPSFESESAFRILRSHDQYTLEGRFCKKNYWYEIFPRYSQREEIPFSQVTYCTLDISDEFANKLISAFHEEVNKQEKPEPEKEIYETINGVVCKVVTVKIKTDGVMYVFSDESSGVTSSKTFHSPFKDEPGYDLCMTASKLAKDLKNQTFEESKYKNLELP